ncbi:MAG: DUF3592 domain-containing protein [Planctomycetota bacterium]
MLTSVVCLILAAIVLAGAGGTAHTLYQQHRTAAWPSTWALVMQSDIRREPGILGIPANRHQLSYEYTVGGRPYIGSRWTGYVGPIDTTRDGPDTRAKAAHLLDEVKVFYDPADPQQAVISPGVRTHEWAIGLTLILAMVLLALRLLRDAWRTIADAFGAVDRRAAAADEHDRTHQLLPSNGPSSTDSTPGSMAPPVRTFHFNAPPAPPPAPARPPHRSPRAVADDILGQLASDPLDDLPDLRKAAQRTRPPRAPRPPRRNDRAA